MSNQNSGIANYSTDEIYQALSTFGFVLRSEDTTDPKVIQQILKEINLNLDIQDPSGLLTRLINERIPLNPLKERILQGIKNNPPLCNTLIEASKTAPYDANSTKNTDQASLKYTLYFMVILEVVSYLMVNDKQIETNIVASILKQQSAIHAANRGAFYDFLRGILITKGDFIDAIKCVSITPFIFESLCCRKYPPFPSKSQLDIFLRENHLKGFTATVFKKKIAHLSKQEKHYGVLCGNILEALLSEEITVNKVRLFSLLDRKKFVKPIDNVKAGLALILYLEKYKEDYPAVGFRENVTPSFSKGDGGFWDDLYSYTTKNNVTKICEIVSTEWMNLYGAWNMAFVLRHFYEKFHIFLPKLCIPGVLSSVPKNYLFERTIALWLTLNFTRALRFNRIKIIPPCIALEPLVTIFGKHNLLYARKLNLPNLDKAYEDRIQARSSISNYLEAILLINS